ncbi:hypothetical protein Tco_1216086 [Tanacetum coccineum]
MEAWDPFISNDSYKSESSNDEEDAKDDGSQSGDKVTTDNDVERVFESSCIHNNDLLYDNNHNNIMLNKDKVLSEDPFNLYDILNKRKDSVDDLKYLPGFTPSVTNMEEVNKKVKWATSNKETKIKSMELVTIKTLLGNSSFNYALCSSLEGVKGLHPSSNRPMGRRLCDYGSFDEVRMEQERYGLVFNVQGANPLICHRA